MRNNLVAQRYAKAVLVNVAADKHELLLEDINCLIEIFSENGEVVSALNSLLYPLKERLQLAETITEKLKIKKVWGNLFQILIRKHRFDIIIDVLDRLEDYLWAAKNKVKTKLILAYEHDDEIIAEIKKIVEKALKCKIEVSVIIDPAIIGGFVAETENMRVDGSIHNNLVKLVQASTKRF